MQFSWANVKVELLIKSIQSKRRGVTLSVWNAEKVLSEVLTLRWILKKGVELGGGEMREPQTKGQGLKRLGMKKENAVSEMFII